jgi:hypothetical protein
LFKFLFESGKFSIRRVVPYLKLFPSIFYLKFLEQGKTPFYWSKFGANLNPFEINLIQFEKPNRAHCAAGPTCQRRADRLIVLPHAASNR